MPTQVETEPSSKAIATPETKKRRWLPLIIMAPYFVGVGWHLIHPIASVFTGDFGNARRWYIDENSLDPSNFRNPPRHDMIRATEQSVSSLCGALWHSSTSTGVSCTAEHDEFEMARVVPTSNAVASVHEAIVLVVPASRNWLQSQFHYSILQLVQNLASSQKAPWLAKTVLVVVPLIRPSHNNSLSSTVESFLNLYVGSKTDDDNLHALPPKFGGTLIRQILVLDVKRSVDKTKSELRVLPQGQRGVLPNMDLVFLCTSVYARVFSPTSLVMHPYGAHVHEYAAWMKPRIPNHYHGWLEQLLHLLAFEYTLVWHDNNALPHASALDRGIDSLTLQASLRRKEEAADLVSYLELVIRALSNLHEKLHHSTSLYLLVSHERFVKHEEYLVPNLLLIIPLIVRAVTLVLLDLPRFQLKPMSNALFVIMGCVLLASLALDAVLWVGDVRLEWVFADRNQASHWAVGIAAYVPFIWYMYSQRSGDSLFLDATRRQSLQFMACLIGVYIHVAIAFGHVALAFPSSLWWTPLIAFPSYNNWKPSKGALSTALRWTAFFVTMPDVLVPALFPTYTPYILYAYLPLHLLTSMLWLS